MLTLETQVDTLPLGAFMEAPGVVIDVRSPGEFLQGRIPDAVNVPLFSNDERAEVGTCYKQVGPEAAVELGLRLVQPRLDALFESVEAQVGRGLAKVHCWRGGMRSRWMADFLQQRGLSACTLEGGYKSFRRWALVQPETARDLRVLGGLTGSGKTRVLQALEASREQVLDLEGLARHRGSAFGHIGQGTQPSTEQFENAIAVQWADFDPQRPVWIEDESRMVGRCKLPDALFEQMQQAEKIVMEVPLEERLDILLEDYGTADKGELLEATQKIHRRLGGTRAAAVLKLIQAGARREAFALILSYYDKSYARQLQDSKGPVQRICEAGLSPSQWARKLSGRAESFYEQRFGEKKGL